MSMHFAPQWVKPIKPSGTTITPTTETPAPPRPSLSLNSSAAPPNSNIPFPALSQNHSQGAQHPPPNNPALSYSRITHTLISPAVPNDYSYFPHPEQNGTDPNPHPFRYSREQILALWDEDKVKNTPIELKEMLNGVLVSKSLVKPVGLRDINEVEKKLLSTSVHPPAPSRRPVANSNLPIDPAIANSPLPRRTLGPQGAKDSAPPTSGRGGGFGGFARGEGGAFGNVGTGKIGTIGGAVIPGEGKMPGALGGGFGGVGRRMGRGRTESGDAGPGSTSWRPARTTSGSFEGVLAFGGNAAPPALNLASTTQTVNESSPNDRGEVREGESFGNGGGPGWGTGQKKWRIAAGINADGDKSQTIEVPISNSETVSDSIAATPSATPILQRDATLATPSVTEPPTAQEKEDLGAVEWFYRDPGGQEQGPFTGSQMHEWYSHSYFTDDLPLRRTSETTFQPLAELKTATGNAVQPFLAPVRPRNLPPNLPIPLAALATSPQHGVNGMTDSFRTIGLATPAPSADHRMPPQNNYIPDSSALSPNQFNQQAFNQLPSPAGSIVPSPGQGWGAPQNMNARMNTYGSVGMPSPIGSAPLSYMPQPVYSPVIGHVQRDPRQEVSSPSVGVGVVPASPWGVPPQQPQISPYTQHAPVQAWQTDPQQLLPQPQQYELLQNGPSYLPPTQEAEINAAPEPQFEDEELAPEPEVSGQPASPESDHVEAPEEKETTPSKPPASVWGQKSTSIKTPSSPSSRKSSIVAGAPTPAPAPAPTPTQFSSKLPPAPASLPPKPVTTTSPITEKPTTQTLEKAPSTRPAPWAEKESGRTMSSGPSLREIQEIEAKEAESRKAVRATASTPVPASSIDDIPQMMTWGLPTSGQKANFVASPVVAAPAAPAWGGGDAGPKKTLKQIQEEEETRKAKAAQAAKVAQAGVAAPKRGYADLAAASQPGAGWTTVGQKPSVPVSTPVRPPSSVPPKPVSSIIPPRPTTVTTPSAKVPKVNGVNVVDESSSAPSVDFIRWTKQALTGLTVNVDDFIQILLTFPIDPPASSRPEVLEIISDSVYASSSTLDGRRFAQEFFDRRKADAARPKSANGTGNVVGKATGTGSLADVVKSVPKKVEDAGFRVVKAKGKKKN